MTVEDSFLVQLIKRVRLIAFDFDGVFTDNKVYVSETGEEAVMCTRADGIGLSKLRKMGIDSVIISSEPNPCVMKRSEKLGIKCWYNCDDKLVVLKDIIENLNITLDQVAFVGNDINDLECLKKVGLPIVVQDAHEDVTPYAKFRTKTEGGHGAVREICDLFEKSVNN